jgi:hypothetical protein
MDTSKQAAPRPGESVDGWGRAQWNPVLYPYRASVTVNTNAPGMYGWRHDVRGTFATEQEARAALADMPRAARCGEVHRAENAETWARNGKWRLVAKIKPNAALPT